jgi:diacylglycerol kinase (ATP)
MNDMVSHAAPGAVPRTVLLVCNRLARQGDAVAASLGEALEACSLDVVDPGLEDPELIPELIRRYAAEVDVVVLAGGDGTISGAAGALRETGVPFAIVPLGTANDLARTLAIPDDPAAACRLVTTGRIKAIDLGEVNGRYFFNAAHIGLGVEVERSLESEIKERWGVLAYARATLDALSELRPFAVEIRADGRRQVLRSVQITVGNGRYYGGGMTIAEDAAIDDARLDLYSVAPVSGWQLLRLAPDLRRGRQDRLEAVEVLAGREIEVRTRHPKRVIADGEPIAHTPAVFRVLPGAVRVIVPDDDPQ